MVLFCGRAVMASDLEKSLIRKFRIRVGRCRNFTSYVLFETQEPSPRAQGLTMDGVPMDPLSPWDPIPLPCVTRSYPSDALGPWPLTPTGFPMTIGAFTSWALECVHHKMCVCVYLCLYIYMYIYIYMFVYIRWLNP